MKSGAWVLAGLLTVPAALHGDWLVTRQGERFEIKGAWQAKGKLIVFTLPSGTLSSMRADRLDLEASRRVTAEAGKAPQPQPAAAAGARSKRRALIVLTDKDFQKAPPAAAPAAGSSSKSAPDGGSSGAAGAKTTAAPGKDAAAKSLNPEDFKDSPGMRRVPSSVEIVAWDRVPASETKVNGTEISGTLRNASQDYLTQVSVAASLFDDNGAIIARFPVTVDSQLLPPGATSRFHLAAEGIFTFGTITWDTVGKGIRALPGGAPPAEPGKPPGR